MRPGNRFNRQAVSGSLALMSPAATVATGTGTNPAHGWCSLDGKHVYVAYQNSGELGQFARNSDGSLTPLSTPKVACAFAPYRFCESADGLHLYVTTGGSDKIRRMSRDTSTGLLTLANSFVTGTTPTGICISPDGAYVYCANKTMGGIPTISMFSRNATTGDLTALSPATISFGTSGCQPLEILIVGTNVYVGCFSGTLFYAFDQNPTTGQLTAAATPSYTAGSQPAWLGVSPDGTSLYAVNDGSGTVSQYSRNTSTGVLTSIGSAIAAGNGPYSIEFTPDGKFVYVGASDGQTIRQYSRNTSTGILTALSPVEVRTNPRLTAVAGSGGPQSINVSRDGRNVYCYGNNPVNEISQFHIRP